MRDWKKNPPTEEEIEASNQAIEVLKQRYGQDIETIFYTHGEQIIIGTTEGIQEFNSGKKTDKIIKQCGYCEKFVIDNTPRSYRSFDGTDFCSEECYFNYLEGLNQMEMDTGDY